jgi:hypothetical protein
MSERAIASVERVNGREGASSTPTPRPRPGGPRRGTGRWWPGRGRGELAGIGGQLRIDVLPEGGHVPTLDYELG